MTPDAQLENTSQENGTAPVSESLPERQYCVFRAGRERFCLHVLDTEEVVEWPSVTKTSAGACVSCRHFQPARKDRAGD